MSRFMPSFVLSLALLVGFSARDASACPNDGTCQCACGMKKDKPEAAKPPAPPPEPAKGEQGAKGEKGVQPAPAEKQGSTLLPGDTRLAAKCDCESAGDCTCKKGQCQCKRCGLGAAPRAAARVFPKLSGQANPLTIPASSKRDASAGLFL
jgi:hypothetical protein